MNSQSFYGRFGLIILIVIVFLLPASFKGARLALKSNHNDVKEWLPAEYPETQQFAWFREYFAGEQFVLMSWDGNTLKNPTKLTLLANDLRPPKDETAPRFPHHDLISEVVTGPDLLNRLMSGTPPLTYPEAHDRLKGLFIGPDNETTCIVVTLSKEGAEHLRDSVKAIRSRALEVANLSKEALKMGGPPVDNVALDEEGESALITLAAYSVIIGLVVSWWCLRSMPLVMMVFFTGMHGGMIALAIVYYTGGTMNAILLTMPSLVYVAATSGAIHLANYYREAVMEHGVAGAASYAVRHALLPLSLATGTTTIGLLSLFISELVPIKYFGLYSAIGVTATLIPLLLLMPSMLELWPVTRTNTFKEFLLFFPRLWASPFIWSYRKLTGTAAAQAETPATQQGPASSWINPIELLPWARVGENVIRHNMLWIGAMSVLMGIAAYGVLQCETSVNLMRFFSPDSKIRRDYAWLEEHLGPLVPMEVVVDFTPSAPLNVLERMQLVEKIHKQVETLDEVGSAMSPVTFVPQLPRGGGNSALSISWVRRLNRSRDELLASGYMTVGKNTDRGENLGHELWRVSARVQALKDMDYKAFMSEIEAKVQPIVDAANARLIATDTMRRFATATGLFDLPPVWSPAIGIHNGEGTLAEAPIDGAPAGDAAAAAPPQSLMASLAAKPIQVTYTGLIPLVYQAQRSLMEGLKLGFVGDWILIALVMMVVVWDWSAGFLLMIPSVFPALIVFGAMGLMGIVVDTGTVMAPAVALGVTVDDVVHFMLKFRDKIRAGGTRREAILAAYAHCAQAMYQSWGVIGLGLAVFALSHFMPTQRFGWMMVTLLTASTIGNLTLLPAILASPLGSIFTWSIRRQAAKKKEKTIADLIAGDEEEAAFAPESAATVHIQAHSAAAPHGRARDKNVRQDKSHTRK